MVLRTERHGVAEYCCAERMRDLARRCRDLAELTAVPDVVHELEKIARALDDEADLSRSA